MALRAMRVEEERQDTEPSTPFPHQCAANRFRRQFLATAAAGTARFQAAAQAVRSLSRRAGRGAGGRRECKEEE